MDRILGTYQDVFKDELGKLCGFKPQSMSIQTHYFGSSKLARCHMHLERNWKKCLFRMQEQAIISPVPFSNWAVPVVAVVKADGSVIVCGDYKLTVNQANQLDKYPLLDIDDPFFKLAGRKNYRPQPGIPASSARLNVAGVCYNQHPQGLFRFHRLPFGIHSATPFSNGVMKELLQGLNGVVVYLDDMHQVGMSPYRSF